VIYLLDANTLIEAKNRHYGMDFCPAYWDFIELEANNTTLASIDMVYDELKEYGDDLSQWVKDRKDLIYNISSENPDIQKKFAKIADFVSNHPVYSQSEKDRFLSGADPWLIAAASVMEYVIVTHEVIVPPNSKKVKIPNIAQNFEVTWISPFEMIRKLGGKFIL
jgi:hypothetical protein